MATIEEVKSFWERNLCLDKFLESKYLTKEYFEEARNLRYKYHYHIPREIARLKEAKPGGKLLEIGVGMGVDTQLLCESNFDVMGVDLTDKSVEAARARLQHYGLDARIQTANAELLPFEDETFDVVYSFGVLHHTPDMEKALEELRRVLKPGGIALIMLYHKNSLNYLAHLVTNTSFDGPIGEPCPKEDAFTRTRVRELFFAFSRVDISVDYLFGTGWRWVNYFVPMPIKKVLGKAVGWHVMIWAVK